jgi:hypothetical protein
MTVYIVQKRHWQFNDHIFVLVDASPVRAFESPDDAEVYRQECEETERSYWSGIDGWFQSEKGKLPSEEDPLFEVIACELEP